MDKKDKRILTELLINSRVPINILAKKVGVSREVATYRFNKLMKDKTILWLYPIIDTEALEFQRFGCLFQLKNISHEKEKEFLNYLVEHDFVTWLSPNVGRWNVAFDILAKDKNHLQEIVKEITSYISDYLESYLVIPISIEIEAFQTKLLGVNKEINYNKPKEKIKIDNIDLKILELMSTNSRVEYKEISKKIKITPNAIKYRIKKLENSGIIKGYTASIDFRKLGYEIYDIEIKTNISKKENLLKQFLRQHKKVLFFYKHLGHENWDLDIGVLVENSLGLRGFILQLREKFGDILKIHDMYVILEELKGNYAPKGIFKIRKDNLNDGYNNLNKD